MKYNKKLGKNRSNFKISFSISTDKGEKLTQLKVKSVALEPCNSFDVIHNSASSMGVCRLYSWIAAFLATRTYEKCVQLFFGRSSINPRKKREVGESTQVGTWWGYVLDTLALKLGLPLQRALTRRWAQEKHFEPVTAADWAETSLINASALRYLLLDGAYLCDVPLRLPSLFVLQLAAGASIRPAANLSLENTTTFTGLVEMSDVHFSAVVGGTVDASSLPAEAFDYPYRRGYQAVAIKGGSNNAVRHVSLRANNSDGAVGTFLEGAVTAGFAPDAADAAVQASVVAARYGR